MNNSNNSSTSAGVSEPLLRLLKQYEMSALHSLRGPSFMNNDVIAGSAGAAPFSTTTGPAVAGVGMGPVFGAPPGSRHHLTQTGLSLGAGLPLRPSPLKKPVPQGPQIPQANQQPLLSVEKARDDLLLNVLAAAAVSKANFGATAVMPPLMLPRDHSADRTETVIENQLISCFDVGGEKRLCLPQLLNAVLRDFTLPEINKACAELHVHCSQCSKEQLEVLKLHQVLPISAVNCGLITKSDAERLTSYLLQSRQPPIAAPNTASMTHHHHHNRNNRSSVVAECNKGIPAPINVSGHNLIVDSTPTSSSVSNVSNVSCSSSSSSLSTATAASSPVASTCSAAATPTVETNTSTATTLVVVKVEDVSDVDKCSATEAEEATADEKYSSLPVYHACFGRCTGKFKRPFYTSPSSDCIECNECGRLFAPQRFVLHSHRHHETKTCHWGFDSANWRLYLHLTPEMEHSKEAERVLEEEKVKFANVQTAQAQAQVQAQTTTAKRSLDSKHAMYPFAEKRPRLDNNANNMINGIALGIPPIPTLPPVLSDYLGGFGLAGAASATTSGQNMKATTATQQCEVGGAATLPLFMCDPWMTTIYNAVLMANAGRTAPPSTLLPFVVPPTAAGPQLLPQHFSSLAAAAGASAIAAKIASFTSAADISQNLAVEEAADALLKLAPHPTMPVQMDPKHKSASMVSIEPLKKHILHRTQLKLNTACVPPHPTPLTSGQQHQQLLLTNSNKSMVPKVITPEDIGTIDNLLNHYVKDPEGLRMIRAKLDETKRHLDGKMDCLSSQNRILQQEIAYLRNKQTTAASVAMAQTGLPTAATIPTV